MKVEIRVDSARMERMLSEVPRSAMQRVEDAVVDSVLAIHGDARRRVPVDTGRLRNSIGWRPVDVGDSLSVAYEVGTNVEYAPHVEFGTSRMHAQPYLFPAFYAELPRFSRRLDVALTLAAADAARAR